MSEPDYTATQALKIVSPFWSRVRQSLTLNVAITLLVSLIGTSITAIVQFHNLRTDVTELKESFRASKALGEELAAMHQRMDDFDSRVGKQEARWERVDENIDRPTRTRRR